MNDIALYLLVVVAIVIAWWVLWLFHPVEVEVEGIDEKMCFTMKPAIFVGNYKVVIKWQGDNVPPGAKEVDNVNGTIYTRKDKTQD